MRAREGALQPGPQEGRTVDDGGGGGVAGRAGGPSAGDGGGEAAVITRVRGGDAEAYAQLVRARTGVALRAAVASGAGADAQDVVQATFSRRIRRWAASGTVPPSGRGCCAA